MNPTLSKSYSFKVKHFESNEKLNLKKLIYENDYNLNAQKYSPSKYIYNNRDSSTNKASTKKMKYYNNSKNNILKKNNSSSLLTSTQESIIWKKKPKNSMNKSLNFFESSIITNENNKSIYELNNLNKTKPLYYESKKNINTKNSNIKKDFKINNILNSKKSNNKLKRKFEHLLDLALKNDDKNGKIKNNIGTGGLSNMEMTIERIRNQNRTQIFKKKIELNIPNRKKKSNNIESIKKNLSQKLFENVSNSQIYQFMNFNNNASVQNKRNKSFKNSFIYLNDDINYKRERLNNNNCYNMILNTQNIYRPNTKLDYYRKMVENEKIQQKENKYLYDNKNCSNIKYKLKYLTADLKFFDSKHKIYIK